MREKGQKIDAVPGDVKFCGYGKASEEQAGVPAAPAKMLSTGYCPLPTTSPCLCPLFPASSKAPSQPQALE